MATQLGTGTLTGFHMLMRQITSDMILETAPHSQDFKGSAGVVLARMQTPGPHAAHLLLIAQMLSECENCVVIIGSADKSGAERNPFTVEQRKMLYEEALDEIGWPAEFRNRLTVMTLKDLSDEADNSRIWGEYLWANAVAQLPSGMDKFRIYYSDDEEIIKTWFPTKFLKNHVEIRHLDREDILEGLSATRIREAILRGDPEDLEYIFKYCPSSILAHMTKLRKILREVQGK